MGVTITLALRMGLHRSLRIDLDPTHAGTRCRMFWTIRNMEARLTSLLGLPRLLPEDDYDQEMPEEVNEGTSSIMPLLYPKFSSKLTQIMVKITQQVYPIKNKGTSCTTTKYLVSYSEIRHIERELEDWQAGLPPTLTLDAAMNAPRYTARLHNRD